MMNKLNNYSIHGQKQASHDKKNVTSSCITIAWKWHLKHCWIVELLTYPSWWQALLLLERQQNNHCCCCANPIKEEVMSSFYSWDSPRSSCTQTPKHHGANPSKLPNNSPKFISVSLRTNQLAWAWSNTACSSPRGGRWAAVERRLEAEVVIVIEVVIHGPVRFGEILLDLACARASSSSLIWWIDHQIIPQLHCQATSAPKNLKINHFRISQPTSIFFLYNFHFCNVNILY